MLRTDEMQGFSLGVVNWKEEGGVCFDEALISGFCESLKGFDFFHGGVFGAAGGGLGLGFVASDVLLLGDGAVDLHHNDNLILFNNLYRVG
jgi:hypothetical protein